MMRLASRRVAMRLLALLLYASAPALADEGMWTFDHFPQATVAQRYGTRIDQAWLDHVRLSTVRLAGCTASFVSDQGLLLTNHHCVESCLAQNSTREKSLIETGFTAAAREQELRCPVQIAEVLEAMEDVTVRVAAALKGLDDRTANDRRRQTLVSLEQSCEDASKEAGNPLKCQAVTLYDGGQYWLYKYRRYDDVRLVFAPEAAIAAFGGDPDNFQFPRWCFDMSLLRAYENGRPASTPNHLTIDFAGPKAGDPVFVAGHPGSTDRQLTVAELETLRNVRLPQALLRAAELRGRYIQFAKEGPEQERIVRDSLNGLENSIKVQRRQLDALLDDGLLIAKHDAEADLRLKIARSAALKATITGDPWARIEAALAVERRRWLPYVFIEGGSGFNSRLYRYARELVRAAAERPKPNSERLREYTDASLPRIEQQIAAPVPIYADLERLTLSFGLERMREWLGPDDPVVRSLLTDDTPDSLAARLVDGSGLADPAARLALWNGGAAAVAASTDPMIALAKQLDATSRELRKWHEDEVEAVIDAAHEQIARARFAALGTAVYPDATFTLRLSFGTVAGWDENGTAVEPFTRLARLFERATGRPPFAVPAGWQAARGTLDPVTPFDLATDNDIVGGNSGSPLIAADGRIVGLVFDGNIHSISGAYWFNAARNRAVAVDMAIVREALTKVYRPQALLRELRLTE
ncbi:MAG TPA: S46 family peptidase [Gammaproteobacteria bacterium]|nr:S46 family peptidase [Gammaproteobacteria bacterium]